MVLKIRFALKTAALALGGMLIVHPCRAGNSCPRLAAEAMKACTTQDTQAGMSDGGSRAEQLLQEIGEANARIERFKSGVGPVNGQSKLVAAEQCRNQKELARKLSEMSKLKAEACSKAFSQCASTCADEAKKYGIIANGWSKLEVSGKAQEMQNRSDEMSQKEQTCSGYEQNASAARQQAQERSAAADVNRTCESLLGDEGKFMASLDTSRGVDMTPRSGRRGPGAAGGDDETYEGTGRAVRAASDGGGSNRSGLNSGQSASETSGSSEATVAGDGTVTILTAAGEIQLPLAVAKARGLIPQGGPANKVKKPQGKDGFGRLNFHSQASVADSAPQVGGQGDPQAMKRRADGITSSTGPSLWEKVSKQYQRQKGLMILD